MSESELDLKEILNLLTKDLNILENSLNPLFEGENEELIWNDKLNKLGDMERAKMNILISYTINDLIWIYLKLKGIDPDKHDVSSELDRIRTYYTKINQIEQPEIQRNKIDSEAAKRFVKNSIPKSQHLPLTSAAQLAQQQALNAISEQQQEKTLNRLGKASRFRFIENEGKEKLIPGQNDDVNDDDNEDEDENMQEGEDSEQEEEEEEKEGSAIADDFLKSVEEEMKGKL
ncbi:uncharacterized protein I206_104290 [Kwoniella pini CBS 10737]|uniref:Exosome complex protein n=1 Tax=Kwoniella pini CBS 10737 TaxID=1296096 RepID=A0A1B9I2D7_9TREE|nr:uncharacterized protein I206_04133 [Kwoniella pini CBS 10737]OCF49611.1 hypothetical protein I206_04133 [Kwoniella pini CBS 10737]